LAWGEARARNNIHKVYPIPPSGEYKDAAAPELDIACPTVSTSKFLHATAVRRGGGARPARGGSRLWKHPAPVRKE
jgi:hypothetical protein